MINKKCAKCKGHNYTEYKQCPKCRRYARDHWKWYKHVPCTPKEVEEK